MSRSHRQKLRGVHSRRFGRAAWVASAVVVFAVVAIGVALFAGRPREPVDSAASAASSTSTNRTGPALAVIDVYKTPTCGCCSKWVEHLRHEGFEVRTTDLADLAEIKASHGVPRQLESCHTALVAGYVLEGHVPGADVQRLLEERPAIAGLAVPGMPIGSPGMEIPGSNAQPYDVIAFRNDGSRQVFATHGR